MWGEIELSNKQSRFIETITTFIILILISYIFLVLANGILLIIFLLVLVHIIAIRFVIFYSKNYKDLDKLDEELTCSFNKRNLRIIFVGFIITFLLVTTPYITSYIPYNSEQSQLELQDLVDDIVDDLKDDESKTLAILKWFDRGENKTENISNIYYRFNQQDVFVLLYSKFLYEGFFYSKYPYFGFRLPDTTDDWHSWIYHSRIGRCGEYSRLFSMMCYIANITVREVSCNGEDHDWNEVKIDDKWIVIDATAVNLPCRNGYNISTDFMENKVKGDLISNGMCVDEGNVSYVYAIYPDDLEYEEDITHRYSDIVNISITVLNEDNQTVKDAKVRLFSYNRLIRRDAHLTKYSNESGICFFNIGGGNYSFEVSYNGLSGKLRDSFNEDILNHSRNITIE